MGVTERYYKYIEDNRDVDVEFVGNSFENGVVFIIFEGKDIEGNVLEVRVNQHDYKLSRTLWVGEGHRLGDFGFGDYTDELIYVNGVQLEDYLEF